MWLPTGQTVPGARRTGALDIDRDIGTLDSIPTDPRGSKGVRCYIYSTSQQSVSSFSVQCVSQPRHHRKSALDVGDVDVREM
jgi:hypothetical protein